VCEAPAAAAVRLRQRVLGSVYFLAIESLESFFSFNFKSGRKAQRRRNVLCIQGGLIGYKFGGVSSKKSYNASREWPGNCVEMILES
jgi:hypothetical protein